MTYASRIGIIPAARYEDWYDDYCKEVNDRFDQKIEKLVAEHWGEGLTEFKLVKRDYNIVYSVTLKGGQ